jgi:hypothetical protein
VLVFLLLWVTFEPILTSRRLGRAALEYPATEGVAAIAPVYHRILVPLDHTALDLLAVGHATAMAKLYGAKLNLLHVEEGVTSQIYGGEATRPRWKPVVFFDFAVADVDHAVGVQARYRARA